jgi:hypothetical protein
MKITRLKVISNTPKYLDDLFDAKTGYGQVPNSETIDYFGFTVYMKPSEFLALALPSSLKPEFYEQCIKTKEPMGYPFLGVKLEFGESAFWAVENHEGRHRMAAIQNVLGDNNYVPVHVFPVSMRNRDLTPSLLSMPFLPEGHSRRNIKENSSALRHFKPDFVDVKSSHLNVGVKKRIGPDMKHPALSAQWQSELNRPTSPAQLIKVQRNDDDANEVLQDKENEMNVYHNASPVPKGTSLPRRSN